MSSVTRGDGVRGGRRLGRRVSGAAGALPNFEARSAVGVLRVSCSCSPDLLRAVAAASEEDRLLAGLTRQSAQAHLDLQKHSQDEQASHRACVGACRRPRGALRAARVANQRPNRPNSTKTQCDASSGPCARLSTFQRVALRPRYEPPPLRPATQQKPPRVAHGSNGGSRPRATQIALPRNGTNKPPALATTLP